MLYRETARGEAQLSTLNTFMWGLDLSGSMQGAGGVGGLAMINEAANGVHFAAFDGNGNLTALLKASDGTPSARYEYGAFGEVIRATGAMTATNPFRFSTKHREEETDLVYYFYRYYSPSIGRWPNRDPLGDEAFLLMVSKDKTPQEQQLLRTLSLDPSYPFTRNNPINYIDPNGEWVVAVVVGGAAIVTLAIVLPDWDARSLTQAEAKQVQTLLLALKGCARNESDNEIITKLEAMTVAGAFKKPRDNDDSAETRNGRFFGYGNRTLLPSKFFSEDDWLKFNILLHESYHAATEDWTENHTCKYADDKLEKLRCCLAMKGYKFPSGPLQ